MVAIVVIVAAVGSGGGGNGVSKIKDPRWRALVSCLESHPLFKVYDAGSQNASAPGQHTNALDIWQNLKGVDLAYVGNNALGADDFTGAGAAAVNRVLGPIHYGFSDQADAQNQLDITSCIHHAYG